MEKIRIGQIGVRHEHAGAIMQSLRRLPDLFEVVGVVDDRHSPAIAFAGNNLAPYEGLPWLSETELLQTPGLQAVTIETANLDLVPTALRCLEFPLALHMDKPGGDDLDRFATLRDECEKRQRPFQMGYMFRSNPAMLWVREAAERGQLGDIFAVQADMSHDYGGDAYQDYLGHFPGGIMFNLGCHLIDFVVSLLGRPGRVTPFLQATPDVSPHACNHATAILEYPHALVTLRASSREANGLEHRRLKVCGTRGSVELSPLECFDGRPLQMELSLRTANEAYPAGTQRLDFGVQHDRYRDHLREFAALIRREIPDRYPSRHDCLVQEIVMAASGQRPR